MPRQRMRPGRWGKITVRAEGGKFVASAYVRDSDGVRRQVERSGKSDEDARRNLEDHLHERSAPTVDISAERTSLDDLFTLWIASRRAALKPQTIVLYERIWKLHGRKQIGELRIGEMSTAVAEKHIQAVARKSPAAARTQRSALIGMFALAARADAVPRNPIRETARPLSQAKPARALTPDEVRQVRTAVQPFRLLPELVDVLLGTGARPGEVLALRGDEVHLADDPPWLVLSGTVVDSGHSGTGKPIRQALRKGDAPDHKILLPRFAAKALSGLPKGAGTPVFATEGGGWLSLSNVRRQLKAALSGEADLSWVTPYTLRRTAATIIRDALGVEAAQRQLSHSRLETTQRHYVERITEAPDARAVLDSYVSDQKSNVSGK
ncbi:tyrosine-type recombinase/integrase [Nocardia flavorosea]|uniref:tyrosine-type recombinase/integrase n=1 Tax=Nocardia flavorosea TaxID=53429 RepID=UPI002455BF7F|nr:tyrosine-type recombinase/integrase [Nocardia flavorosea]